MNLEKQILAYKTAAENYTKENLAHCLGKNIQVNQEEYQYIVDITMSILMTRDGVGYPGGHFAKAVVNDDNAGILEHGDVVCIKALNFFITANKWCAVSY